jgi:hypothetical protein
MVIIPKAPQCRIVAGAAIAMAAFAAFSCTIMTSKVHDYPRDAWDKFEEEGRLPKMRMMQQTGREYR